MSNFENEIAYDFLKIQSVVNVLTGISEALAWATFGINPISKGLFIAWAVVMVWARPQLAQAEQMALERGDERAAHKAKLWLKVTIIITAISLFSLYSEAMDNYKAKRMAESAPVQLASSRYEEQKQKFASAASGYNETAASEALAKKKQLEIAMQSSRENYTKVLEDFWVKKHSSGLSYGEITDENCAPKTTKYGLMKKAATEVCSLLPQSPGDLKHISSEIKSLDAILLQHQLVLTQRSQLQQAEQAFLQAKQNSGNTGDEILPPVFHRVSSLLASMGMQASPEQVSSVFAILVILCILNLQNILQIARTSIRNPNAPPPTKPGFFRTLLDHFRPNPEKTELPPKTVAEPSPRTEPPKLAPISASTCEHCKQPFIKKTPWHKYCSDECRAQANGFSKEAV